MNEFEILRGAICIGLIGLTILITYFGLVVLYDLKIIKELITKNE